MKMIQLRAFKKFLIPGAVGVAVKNGSDEEGKTGLTRPSELPIYGDECYICGDKPCDDPSDLEAKVGHLRKELWVWVDKYKGIRQQVIEVCSIGRDHAEATLETLREESNYMPRAGAIGLSGLAGIVFGMRGGIIRKLTYGSVGAGTMMAVCYPREAGEYTDITLRFAKKYVKVGYNFIYGVKPDYIKLPDPSSFLSEGGADVAKSSSVNPVLGPKASSPIAVTPVPPPVKEDTMSKANDRDQSKPEDKSMYTTRS